MEEIFKYIDRIFSMIRPRRLLYLAIDGVAPRAKMNQQRSRRFRAAQKPVKAGTKGGIATWNDWKGDECPEEDVLKLPLISISNCITPGTPFMDLVAKSLRYYINDRINTRTGLATN